MKKFTEEMVIDYAEKLLIGLEPDEIKMVLDEFDIIDANIDIINKIEDIENVTPMTHCLDYFNCILREDIEEESVDIDELLDNCDDILGREVKVPKVVE